MLVWSPRTGKSLAGQEWVNDPIRNQNAYVLCLKKNKKEWKERCPTATVLTKEEFRKDPTVVKQPTALLIDECFVAGTQVLTESGYKNIEDIRIGDKVKNAFGFYAVKQTMDQLKDRIIILRLVNGTTFKVTENHRFFTSRGWVKAIELNTTDVLLHEYMVDDIIDMYDIYKERGQDNNMPFVQKRVYTGQRRSKKLYQILCEEKLHSNKEEKLNENNTSNSLYSLWQKNKENWKRRTTNEYLFFWLCDIFTKEKAATKVVQCKQAEFRENDKKQSNEQSRNKEKSERNIKDYWSQAKNPWGKWTGHAISPTSFMGCIRRRLENRTSCIDWCKNRNANLLQSRHSASNKKDSDRSRWLKSQYNRQEDTRYEKDRIFKESRVESVTLQKQTGTRVYNLSVEGHPSYYVNNYLVHNCHHFHSPLFIAKKRSQLATALYSIVKNNPEMHIMGLTGTPLTNDPASIHTLLVYLGKYIPWGQFQDRFYELKYMPFLPRPAYFPIKHWREPANELLKQHTDIVSLHDCVDWLPPEIVEVVELKTKPKVYASDEAYHWTKDHKHEQSEKAAKLGEIGEGYRKVLVVCHYTDQIDELAKKLKSQKPVFVLDGRTKNQAAVIKEAQESLDCFFIVQAAMGEGFDGYQMDCMVFASMDHTVRHHTQMLSRLVTLEKHLMKPKIYIYLLAGKWDRHIYNSVMAGEDFNPHRYHEK